MKREIGWDDIVQDETSVVTVGTFDGVHRGHQAIVEYLLSRAEKHGGTSTVISFDPHPRSVVHGQEVPLLTTVAERGELLADLGLDRMVVIPFTEAFARIEAVRYVEEILVERIGMQEIVIGYDHRFGNNREGDRQLLERLGETHGFAVDVIPAQVVDHDVVSSSTIREALHNEGDVGRAATLLGRSYHLRGTVRHGEKRGRRIGFPTANITLDDPRKLTPKIGVYATLARVEGAADVYGGMMNIGRRPTFDGMDVTVEVHLLDFDGDLYDQTLRVEFLRRLRDEQKFDSVDDLRMQLSEDKVHCKQVIEALAS